MGKIPRMLIWLILLGLLVVLLAACEDANTTEVVFSDVGGPDPCAGMPLLDCELKDAGIDHLRQAGLGKHLNLMQSKNGFEVEIQYVYADLNLVIIAYTIGRADRLQFNYGYSGNGLSDAQGIPLTMVGGGNRASRDGIMGGLEWYNAAPLVKAGTKELHLNFDLLNLQADRTYFFYQQSVKAGFITPSSNSQIVTYPPTATAVPPPAGLPAPDWTAAAISTSFHFDLTVPVETESREIVTSQTARAGGETITLKRMVVTPAQARFYISSSRDDLKGELTLESWNSTGMPLNRKTTYNLNAGEHLVCFDFENSLSGKKGQWHLTLRLLDLSGAGKTSSQQAQTGWPVTFVFAVN